MTLSTHQRTGSLVAMCARLDFLHSRAASACAGAGLQPEHPGAEDGDDDDGDEVPFPAFAGLESDALACLRPGIVHRLDKGTTGEHS